MKVLLLNFGYRIVSKQYDTIFFIFDNAYDIVALFLKFVQSCCFFLVANN
jgi:hypothetical protein